MGGEVCEAAVGGEGADEDVARDDGLDVCDGEGVFGLEKDLRFCLLG